MAQYLSAEKRLERLAVLEMRTGTLPRNDLLGATWSEGVNLIVKLAKHGPTDSNVQHALECFRETREKCKVNDKWTPKVLRSVGYDFCEAVELAVAAAADWAAVKRECVMMEIGDGLRSEEGVEEMDGIEINLKKEAGSVEEILINSAREERTDVIQIDASPHVQILANSEVNSSDAVIDLEAEYQEPSTASTTTTAETEEEEGRKEREEEEVEWLVHQPKRIKMEDFIFCDVDASNGLINERIALDNTLTLKVRPSGSNRIEEPEPACGDQKLSNFPKPTRLPVLAMSKLENQPPALLPKINTEPCIISKRKRASPTHPAAAAAIAVVTSAATLASISQPRNLTAYTVATTLAAAATTMLQRNVLQPRHQAEAGAAAAPAAEKARPVYACLLCDSFFFCEKALRSHEIISHASLYRELNAPPSLNILGLSKSAAAAAAAPAVPRLTAAAAANTWHPQPFAPVAVADKRGIIVPPTSERRSRVHHPVTYVEESDTETGSSPRLDSKDSSSPPVDPLTCHVCGLRLKDGLARAQHIITQHRDKLKLSPENAEKKAPSCPICEKRFSMPSKLKEHLKIHSGNKIFCAHCPGKFSHESGYLTHLRSDHHIRPYECDQCDEKFYYADEMRKHAGRNH